MSRPRPTESVPAPGPGAEGPLRFATGACSLGSFLVAWSARGIRAIALGDEAGVLGRELLDRLPHAEPAPGEDADDERRIERVGHLLEDPGAPIGLPLDVRGTAFRRRVWRALREVPPGRTATYAQIAARIGAPRSVRAVAGACGANLLAVAIPCHRVVRSDGGLGGYRWGLERKRTLLRLEREAASGPPAGPARGEGAA